MLPGNYLPEACKGCVLVHAAHPRIFGRTAAGPGDTAFQWSSEDQVFAIANSSRKYVRYTYVTFSGVQVYDRDGSPFATGLTRDDEGQEEWVTTFVVVVPPRVALRLGRVDTRAPEADVTVFPLARLASMPAPERPLGPPDREADEGQGSSGAFHFPLPAACGPYLCTQGAGGHLTHFFPESYHAIDLRCDLDTPVLSIGRGVVKSISNTHTCGGIHMARLSEWNDLTIQLDCGLLVDYVHTSAATAFVKPGDRVEPGQPLCKSGDIGFAPEPHLHIELHRASDPEGPSVPLRFGAGLTGSTAFLPEAGRWYSIGGETAPAVAPAAAERCAPCCSSVVGTSNAEHGTPVQVCGRQPGRGRSQRTTQPRHP